LALTPSNWKPVSISALVLAQKVWDDTPLINADFSILYPAITVKDINLLERKFLDLLEFKLAVSPSLYAQYYFELRSICEENNQNQQIQIFQHIQQSLASHLNIPISALGSSTNPLPVPSTYKPLPKALLKQIEQKTHFSEEYQKDKYSYKKRSTTVEDIGANYLRPILS
jgi:hypothetical protein